MTHSCKGIFSVHTITQPVHRETLLTHKPFFVHFCDAQYYFGEHVAHTTSHDLFLGARDSDPVSKFQWFLLYKFSLANCRYKQLQVHLSDNAGELV